MESRRPAAKLVAPLGLSSLAFAVLLCLAGCVDSTRKVATYHPPVIQAATVQQPSAVQPSTVQQPRTVQQPSAGAKAPAVKAAPRIGVLPLLPSRGHTVFLALLSPDAVNRLAAQVRTLFSSAEQEF